MPRYFCNRSSQTKVTHLSPSDSWLQEATSAVAPASFQASRILSIAITLRRRKLKHLPCTIVQPSYIWQTSEFEIMDPSICVKWIGHLFGWGWVIFWKVDNSEDSDAWCGRTTGALGRANPQIPTTIVMLAAKAARYPLLSTPEFVRYWTSRCPQRHSLHDFSSTLKGIADRVEEPLKLGVSFFRMEWWTETRANY